MLESEEKNKIVAEIVVAQSESPDAAAADETPVAPDAVLGVQFKDPLIGMQFANFAITELIGRGAMGSVYKARQMLLDRDVAIKVLHRHLCSDQNAIKRFNQEAKSASKLEHPSIVDVHDFGILPDGSPYLVLDYVDGCKLADIIKEKPLTPQRALTLCSKICEALAVAHETGIVHRDIKPSNVMVVNPGTDGEQIRVVDFGIAKLIDTDVSLTQTGSTVGSPPYMSPEQCQSQGMDGRSDIYSLGCVLYEMLVGEPPFKSDSIYEMINLQINAQPAPVGKRRPDIKQSLQLDAIVLKAMAKDPARRYQKVEDFKRAIDEQISALNSGNRTRNLTAAMSVAGSRFSLKKLLTIAGVMILLAVACMSIFRDIRPEEKGWQRDGEPSLAQSVLPLADLMSAMRSAESASDSYEWTKATTAWEEAIRLAAPFGEEDPRFLRCLAELSKCYIKTGQPDSAKAADARLRVLQQFQDDRGSIIELSNEITRAASAISRGDAVAANRQRLMRLQTNRAQLYWGERDSGNAIESAEEALALWQTCKSKDTLVKAKNLTVLVACSANRLKLSEAQKFRAEFAKLIEKCPHVSLERALYHMASGRYLWVKHADKAVTMNPDVRMQFLDQSLKNFSQGEALLKRIYGPTSPYLADLYNMMAIAYCSQREYDSAENTIKQAVAINKMIRGVEDPRYATSLADQAWVQVEFAQSPVLQALRTKRNRLMSEAHFALVDAEKVLEREHLQTSEISITVFALQGMVHAYFKEWPESETYFNKALEQSRAITPPGQEPSDGSKYAYFGLMQVYQAQNKQKEMQELARAMVRPPR